MLDARLRPLIDPALDRLGRQLVRLRLTADMVTLGGFVLGLAAIVLVAQRHYVLGLLALR